MQLLVQEGVKNPTVLSVIVAEQKGLMVPADLMPKHIIQISKMPLLTQSRDSQTIDLPLALLVSTTKTTPRILLGKSFTILHFLPSLSSFSSHFFTALEKNPIADRLLRECLTIELSHIGCHRPVVLSALSSLYARKVISLPLVLL